MKNIILVRHGSLASEHDGCYIGSSDLPLSSKGTREAKSLANLLVTFDEIGCIYSSPLMRARQTVLEIAKLLPDPPVIYQDLLREVNFGEWEKLTFAQICKQSPEMIGPWAAHAPGFAFPGGENLGDFLGRISQAKQMLLDSEHENILIVSHGGVLANLICNILDIGSHHALSFKVDRGSLSTLSLFENGKGILTSLNLKP